VSNATRDVQVARGLATANLRLTKTGRAGRPGGSPLVPSVMEGERMRAYARIRSPEISLGQAFELGSARLHVGILHRAV
jgi:hypothetical protein